jgi:hypothetical protein
LTVLEDTESQERTMSRSPIPSPAPPETPPQSSAARARELYDGLTSWPHREPTFVAAVVAVLILLAIVAVSMI